MWAFTRHSSTSPAETHWEITVGMATPSTPMPRTMTQNRFSTTLTIPARNRKYRGRWVSPTARRMAAPKL